MVPRRVMQVVGLVLGWLLTAAGIALIFVPAALIVAGVSLAAFCLFVLDDGTTATHGGAQ